MNTLINKLIGVGLVAGTAVPSIALAAEGGDVGMPQFDSSTFASQLFWLAVTFAVLFLLMWKVALPRVGDTLAKREQKISGDISKAAELKEEAEKVQADLEKALAEARADAQEVIRKANEAIAKDQDKRIAAFEADLAAKTEEAAGRIDAARKTALEGVREVATEVTTMAVAKIAGADVDDKTVAAALDAVAKEG